MMIKLLHLQKLSNSIQVDRSVSLVWFRTSLVLQHLNELNKRG
jgi:hypothetical protein